MSILFDPRDARCKSPFGAVTTFAAVDFTFYPRGHAVTGCTLLAHHEFSDRWTETELLPTTDEDGAPAFSGTFFAPSQPELIWYHFRLRWADGGESCYGKDGFQSWDKVTPWQLTVYDGRVKTPGWFGRGVTYQIFPDRFYRARTRSVDGLIGCRTLHERWDETPLCGPNERGDYCEDFFGGDLAGITEKLDYLASLHVTTLYLNPIFEAASNHRYDTADYETVDPLLGDEQDFRTLCTEAEKRGIRVMLDGVFNHTGAKSRYFNADGFYPAPGAAQGPISPYYSWYSFHPFPTDYDAWWGIKNLPAVNERNENYVNYIITGENSIVRRWLRAGASAWRLDVADELPDEFIFAIRAVMQQDFPDAYLLGEVWEDGTTKVAYSKRRRYLLGGGLHGLMNYPFRTALLSYLAGTSGAEDFRDAMETIRENYPSPAFYGAMNFLSTHDTPRLLTLLGCEQPPADRDARAHYRLSPPSASAARRCSSSPRWCFTPSPARPRSTTATRPAWRALRTRSTAAPTHGGMRIPRCSIGSARSAGSAPNGSRCKAAASPILLLRAACSALPAARAMRSPFAPSTPARKAPRSTCRGQRRSRTTRSAASRFWPKAVGCISPSPPTTLCC